MRRGFWGVSLLLFACSSAPAAPAPRPQGSLQDEGASAEASQAATPPREDFPFPPYPSPLSDEVEACARDYRVLAATPLPPRDEARPFPEWWQGAFQRFVTRYNTIRARCDEVYASLAPDSAEAQVLLGTQSYLHEQLGQEAVPHEEAPEMFVMGRYWTLGASCTYQHCGRGPLDAWSALCRERAARLPACPAPEAAPSE